MKSREIDAVEKEAHKDTASEEMEEDEEEVPLHPTEFEVQARLVRWQPDFPDCLITLYLAMPKYMSQGTMPKTTKAALNRGKQLLDMRASAGSRVVIKVRQADLR